MKIIRKPAAPLPWRVREGYGSILHLDASPEGSGDPDKKPIADLNFLGVWGEADNRRNADYLAHAANVYPKLVAALAVAAQQIDHLGNVGEFSRTEKVRVFGWANTARAVLRSIGEES